MLNILPPDIRGETNVKADFLKTIADNLDSYTMGTTTIFTSKTVYDTSMISNGRYYVYDPRDYMDVNINSMSTHVEFGINPLFINSGYKLVVSNIYDGSARVFFANTDHANRTFGSIVRENSDGIVFMLLAPSMNLDARSHTVQFYSSPSTFMLSFINQYRYLIFTKLLPIDQEDDDKYLIIMSSQTSNASIDTYGDINIIDNTLDSFSDRSARAIQTLSYAYNYNSGSIPNKINLYNYIYGDRWYSNDIYYIYDYAFDAPTLLNGNRFFPLGNNLYLLLRG
jgi:hypothetical protein